MPVRLCQQTHENSPAVEAQEDFWTPKLHCACIFVSTLPSAVLPAHFGASNAFGTKLPLNNVPTLPLSKTLCLICAGSKIKPRKTKCFLKKGTAYNMLSQSERASNVRPVSVGILEINMDK